MIETIADVFAPPGDAVIIGGNTFGAILCRRQCLGNFHGAHLLDIERRLGRPGMILARGGFCRGGSHGMIDDSVL